MTADTFAFQRELAQNNNREWLQANRKRYEAAKAQIEQLVTRILAGVNTFQPLPNTEVKDCIFRINRDIRFSKNKEPYKLNFAAAIGPGGRHSGRIDYYIHIQPGNESFLGAGMWQPTPAQLAKFRQEIDYNVAELKGIIEEETFRAYFPEIWGEVMKTAPKGYTTDHPDIDLLRRKQLFFMHRYSDQDVLQPGFAEEVARGCHLLKPYCDFLNYLFFEEE
ncbi:TIGR02453 family protein [Arsenicibacter rosenii]|uniref:TIGR02453 family protein n=1 Tax=Arsenicibacter rosenii TaxID=1750698 RepID=A0A1S2VP77_9BACT|nr:TIGR02453 family protein [Arsenicibacter rosenii]